MIHHLALENDIGLAMMDRMDMKYRQVSREQFVRIWNEAVRLQEVADKTNTTKRSCTIRAKRLRDMGYDLLRFRGGNEQA